MKRFLLLLLLLCVGAKLIHAQKIHYRVVVNVLHAKVKNELGDEDVSWLVRDYEGISHTFEKNAEFGRSTNSCGFYKEIDDLYFDNPRKLDYSYAGREVDPLSDDDNKSGSTDFYLDQTDPHGTGTLHSLELGNYGDTPYYKFVFWTIWNWVTPVSIHTVGEKTTNSFKVTHDNGNYKVDHWQYQISTDPYFLSDITTVKNITTTQTTVSGLKSSTTYYIRTKATNANGTSENWSPATEVRTPCQILSVSSPIADGYYKAGSKIPIHVIFSEPVWSLGIIRLALETGKNDGFAQQIAGHRSSTFVFEYTVPSGHETIDLQYLSTNAIYSASGSTIHIFTTFNNDEPDLTLPEPSTKNSLSYNKNIGIDTQIPTVTITAAETNPINTPFTATFSFSEDVTGFEQEDISLSNATASQFQQINNSTCSALITPTTDGLVTVGVDQNAAQDRATNGNKAATQIQRSFDGTKPSVGIESLAALHVNAPFMATFRFSEEVFGFEQEDIFPANATVSQFQRINNSTYTALVTPIADGLVTVDVNQNVAQDQATNGNKAAVQLQRNYDQTAPTLVISAPENNPINKPFTATFTFSENVYGFTTDDIQLTNGIVSSLEAIDAKHYSAEIIPAHDGLLQLSLYSEQCSDKADNYNQASNILIRTVDQTAPTTTISIQEKNPTNNKSFVLTINFSEPVHNFSLSDISRTNAVISNLITNDNQQFTVTVSPQEDGVVNLGINTNVANDDAGNVNSASSSIAIEFDSTRPQVTMTSSVSEPTNESPFPITIDFSEKVNGFSIKGLSVVNGSVSRFEQINPTQFIASVTPQANGIVTVSLLENGTTDDAGNFNIAAPALSRTFDSTSPTTTLSSETPSITNKASFSIDINFSNDVYNFESADIQVNNGTISNFTIQNQRTYSAGKSLLTIKDFLSVRVI